jgi:hypothetical protein
MYRTIAKPVFQAYIARIEQVNDVVHAVTEINPDALEIAAGLDAQRANGTAKGSAWLARQDIESLQTTDEVDIGLCMGCPYYSRTT